MIVAPSISTFTAGQAAQKSISTDREAASAALVVGVTPVSSSIGSSVVARRSLCPWSPPTTGVFL